jgi:hypothetical protein
MKQLLILIFLICSALGFAQTKVEEDINSAFQNAKKGIYWALSNIPEGKSRLNNDLVANDKLYCKVKLDKKINGIKIESTGYFNSNEVTVTIYRSFESLVEEGFIKKREKDN